MSFFLDMIMERMTVFIHIKYFCL